MSLYERMTIVAPGEGKGWWELAQLRHAAGKREESRASLMSMLEITNEAGQRARIFATLEAIA